MKKLLIILLVILISSIGTVSASEDLIQEDSLTTTNQISDSENNDLNVKTLDNNQELSANNENNANIKTLTNNQDKPIGNSNEKTFDDIQNSINAASEGSTIELDGTYNGNSKEIIVSKAVTIKGVNGKATLNSKDLSRIFNINSTGVILDNLILINGKSNNGGAIFTKYGLTIKNSDLTGNIANTDGGAIYSKSNEFNSYMTIINNCNFNSNSAKEGGAIYSVSNLKVINSYFNDNSAFSGGAICCEDYDEENNNKLIIDTCTFTKNIALKNTKYYILYNGGGAVVSDFNKATIKNSKFISNTAKTNGGSLYITRNLNCNNCVFTKNTANEYAVAFISANKVDYEDEYEGNYKVQFNKCNLNSNSAKGNVKLIGSKYRHNSIDLNNVIIGKYKYTIKNYNNYYYTVKVVDKKTNKAVKGVKITLNIGNKKKSLKTNKNGNVIFKVKSILKKKNYKDDFSFQISFANSKKYLLSNSGIPGKIPVKVTTPKILMTTTMPVKFKINLKDKVTKKNLKNIKIKVLIYTDNKYKTYKVTSDKKGNGEIKLKQLSIGEHKVIIKSLNSKYDINTKTSVNSTRFMVLYKNKKKT